MLTRRELLARGAQAGAAALLGAACSDSGDAPGGVFVNDVHSQLNRTRVRGIAQPATTADLQELVRRAAERGVAISVAGGRHAMGGQQFGSDTLLIDSGSLPPVLALDAERGEVTVGAGVQWPELIGYLVAAQADSPRPLGIVQKQTGADRLAIGGALAANAHGRGLTLPPMIGDVSSFELIDARGELRRCSRSENPELFALAIGGYGLFGVISEVTLRLVPRVRVERVVEVVDSDGLPERFQERIDQGYLFGDFQYSTDTSSDTLLRRGVFSCYRPADPELPEPASRRQLAERDWLDLITLAHSDRTAAFERYTAYYLSTSGQLYWSDTHQLSTYIDDYHRVLAARLGERASGTEMISELYVPRADLVRFLEDVRADVRAHDLDLIYGTIRMIERDRESFLPWAREPWACVIFNLHTQHDGASLRKTRADFRRLIDRALAYGGSYFLTYHRWASREQVLAAHPRLPAFLERKRALDPQERFQSDWYRHHRDLVL